MAINGRELVLRQTSPCGDQRPRCGEWVYFRLEFCERPVGHGGYYGRSRDVAELAGSIYLEWRGRGLAADALTTVARRAIADGSYTTLLVPIRATDDVARKVLDKVGFYALYDEVGLSASTSRAFHHVTYAIDSERLLQSVVARTGGAAALA